MMTENQDPTIRMEALKLSFSLAEKIGIFNKNWDILSPKERQEAFENLTATAEEFCNFVYQKS